MSDRIPFSASERYYILARDEFTCQYCGALAPDVSLHVDHITPVALGGDNDPLNLLASCDVCNLSKSTHTLLPHVIAEKQKGIIIRTKRYEHTQSTQPARPKKATHPLIQHKPHELFKQHPSVIVEPLKGRRLNPNKRHILLCSFDEEGELTASYHRQTQDKWNIDSVRLSGEQSLGPSVWRPLSHSESEPLIRRVSFTQVDYIREGDREVLIQRSDENIHIIQMIDHTLHRQVHFLLWAPIKTLEIAVDVNKEQTSTYNEEDTF